MEVIRKKRFERIMGKESMGGYGVIGNIWTPLRLERCDGAFEYPWAF